MHVSVLPSSLLPGFSTHLSQHMSVNAETWLLNLNSWSWATSSSWSFWSTWALPDDPPNDILNQMDCCTCQTQNGRRCGRAKLGTRTNLLMSRNTRASWVFCLWTYPLILWLSWRKCIALIEDKLTNSFHYYILHENQKIWCHIRLVSHHTLKAQSKITCPKADVFENMAGVLSCKVRRTHILAFFRFYLLFYGLFLYYHE